MPRSINAAFLPLNLLGVVTLELLGGRRLSLDLRPVTAIAGCVLVIVAMGVILTTLSLRAIATYDR